ncbi:CBS domain-containing protein [Streptomyces sp. NRRL B-1347]|uniref:CBS domain-containing protein n=1 Tax=Streptomyces sp. NRRL B-1347 TaxID=1476877 RepID=UPI0004C7A3EE|nr:CBS domain-containing protein [Streptomyces sp. NRRL B-1347]
MTLVQMQLHPTGADAPRTAVVDTAKEPGPQVWDDMTVEVALSVMVSAGVGHLLVYDEDGMRTGLITLARLTAVRDGSGYTDRIRLRDISGGSGPFTPPRAAAEAKRSERCDLPGTLPVDDGRGSAPAVLGPAH